MHFLPGKHLFEQWNLHQLLGEHSQSVKQLQHFLRSVFYNLCNLLSKQWPNLSDLSVLHFLKQPNVSLLSGKSSQSSWKYELFLQYLLSFLQYLFVK